MMIEEVGTNASSRVPSPEILHINIGLANSYRLGRFPSGQNRQGFPKGRESDSNCMLAKEAGMHEQTSFA